MHFALAKAPLLFYLLSLSVSKPLTLYDLWARDYDTLEWGVIGDSWATGVAAKDADNYLPGSTECLRTNYAYGPQLSKDDSWTAGKKQDFHFAACSGARLVDMAKGQRQVQKTGKPRLVIMTAGGNNADFFNIASNCIYQQEDKDYGPEYADDPSKKGLCAKAIQTSSNYIAGTLENDMAQTVKDILDSDPAKAYDNFFFYLTGYAKFFAANGTWCDDQSFGAFPSRKPKLSLELRKAINSLTDDLNAIYKKVIDNIDHRGVRFVSVDESFETHRFCQEPTIFQRPWWFQAQYYGTLVWFWNLSIPSLDESGAETTEVQSPPEGFTGKSHGVDTPGWQQRPFHPKSPGYTEIKNALIAQMKKDRVPQPDEAAPESPQAPATVTTVAKPSCVPEPTGSVKDAHAQMAENVAYFFCGDSASKTVTEKPDIHQALVANGVALGEAVELAYTYTGDKVMDDVYDISLTAAEDCSPEGGSYNLAEPVKDHECSDVLFSAWRECINQGRGGQVQAGCLIYSMKTRY